ncbi:helix-hairpin-helix domain-containing protein [Candidatus Thorarchaeota archaeon]|nr:MAG: helix-hairpin-helix domain-containing protein [Candidatus Thorarchaeota archaeon]
MRYAHGIVVGAVLPFIIFMVAAVIKITAIGADATGLEMLWDIYVYWFITSIGLITLLPLIIYFVRKDIFRQFLIYEIGGFGLFAPLWLMLFTDISGDPWYSIFIAGITDGLIGFSPSGAIEGIDVSNLFLIPLLISSTILGLIFLRPSFIKKYGIKEEVSVMKKPLGTAEISKSPESTDEESMEIDMPDVNAPTPTVDSVANLREVLIELDIQEPTINLILNSGIGTTTDLVATSAEQLATISGLDKRAAENLLMAVQRKLWFSGI